MGDQQATLRVQFPEAARSWIYFDADRGTATAVIGFGQSASLSDVSLLGRLDWCEALLQAIERGDLWEEQYFWLGLHVATITSVMLDGVPFTVRDGVPLAARLPGVRKVIKRNVPWDSALAERT